MRRIIRSSSFAVYPLVESRSAVEIRGLLTRVEGKAIASRLSWECGRPVSLAGVSIAIPIKTEVVVADHRTGPVYSGSLPEPPSQS